MAKIIEAKAVISAEDRTGAVFDKIGKKFKDLGRGAKVSAEVDKLGKALERITAQQKAIEAFNGRMQSFGAARTRFRDAQSAIEAAAKALAAADKPTKALQGNLAKAQREVSAAARAFERERDAVLGAKQALAGFGGSLSAALKGQAQLAAAADKTAAAMERQMRREQRMHTRREALKGVAATAGVVAAHRGKTIGLDAIQSAADFDIAVRKQRVFTDINAGEQAGLLSQAKRIGQETQFSNIDVVKAQTTAMQGLPSGFAPALKAEVAAGIIENVRNYATLMETDLQEGADTIRGYLQQTGKDISSKEKALAEANKATNQIVKMAKLGGMSGEDVKNFMNFAASPGTSAGVSTETLMSLAALARRGGLRGDVAGTFIRTASSKLVSPTAPGLAALNAAGINFSDYVRMPDRLSTSGLENQFQLKTGKAFTPEIRGKLDAINADKALIADRARYVAAVTDAVSPILGKKKDGTVRASDSRVAAKAVGDFHKVSAQSVDTERLLDDAMSKNMTLPQLNAWLTDKHGGKGAITQRQWDEFKAARAEIKKSGDNPNYAADKAKEVMAGLGGSVENLKGSFENLVLSIGQANEGLVKFSADAVGKGLDAFSNLSQSSQQLISLLGGGAAAGGGIYGALKFMNAVFGNGGGAAALTTSAGLLDGAAGALTTAALKLGGGSLPGVPAGGAQAAAGKVPGAVPVMSRAAAGIPIIGTGLLVSSLFLEGQDPTKGIVHGGRPDPGVKLNPGDELPGVAAALNEAANNLNQATASFKGSREHDFTLGSKGTFTQSPATDIKPGSMGQMSSSALQQALSSITAEVKQPVPVSVTGEANVAIDNKVNVSVTLNEPMLQAKIDAAAGRAAAKIPLSSGGRPGAVSMPGAAGTPGGG